MKNKQTNIFVIILTVLVFFLLLVRVWYVQAFRQEKYSTMSSRQQFAVVPEKPRRGSIMDRRGRILAASNQIRNLFAEPRAISDVKETAVQLQELIKYPSHIICSKINTSENPGYAKLIEDLPDEQVRKVSQAGIFGIGIESRWQRYYPMARLNCHIVGFAGADNTGLAGIEYQYENILSGIERRDILLVDAARKPIALADRSAFGSDGKDIVLTIDSAIQQFTRTALLKQFEQYNAESALAIVIDPWTGEILSMVSLPDFDPEHITQTDTKNMKNRVLTDPFEPGSIFKPIVAAIALDNGIITRTEKFFCENGYFARYRIGEWGSHSFADLDVKEILTESSNVGMAKIGLKMGQSPLYRGLRLFGFGQRTGIDLPGEEPGLLKTTDRWSGYTVTRMPYGYEVNVTGIQIVRAFCVLANGGRLITPHLLKAVVQPGGNIDYIKFPEPLTGQIIKTSVAEWIVQQALANVVNEGTGKEAALEKWQVFGKTGTAHIAMPDQKGYDNENYTASFIGGAPAENPKVVVLVSIRKPDKSLKKGYSGGRVAAPVVGEILEKVMTYLENKPAPQPGT